MDYEGIEQQARSFVRKHSWKVAVDNPQNEVAQAVNRFEANQQLEESRKERQRLEWHRWLQIDAQDQEEEVARLEIECKELMAVWQEFQSRFTGIDDPIGIEDKVPSIWTVKSVVESTVRDWEEKQEKGLGKAKQFLIDYCDTLVSHSNLFAIFPQGDKYTSLFTGVTSSVIHAFARHKENMEGFSRALVEMSDDLQFVQRQGLVHPTPQMKKLVVMLYLKYFRFLCHAMDWLTSRSKRFKAALNQNFYNRQVEEKVVEIKSIVAKIQQEASLQTQGVIEATHSQVMNLATSSQMSTSEAHIVQYISDSFHLAEQQRHLSDQELARRLDLLNLRFEEEAQKAAVAAVEKVMHEQQRQMFLETENRSITTRHASWPNFDELHQQSSIHSVTPKMMHHRRELEFESRSLQNIIGVQDFNITATHSSQLHATVIAGEIVSRLQHWISARSSKVLWLMGTPLSPLRTSDEANAAAHVVDLVNSSGILCMSFFCEGHVGSDVASLGAVDPQQRLIFLLYYLVRQLVLYTPEVFEDDCDYRAEFSQLNGTPESIPRALRLIRRLLGLAPRLLLCVIDGLQRLDQPATSAHIEELLAILREPAGDKVIKLLLTTRGFFPAGAKLDATDRLVCSRLPRKQQGRGQPGGRSIQSLMFP